MPHKGFADPVTSDRTKFYSNISVSELIKHVTRAIEASVISSAPPVAETEDGVTRETWSAPTKPQGPRGLKPPDPRLKDRGSKAGSRRARGRLVSNKVLGRKTQMSLSDLCPSRLEADKAVSTFSFDPSL